MRRITSRSPVSAAVNRHCVAHDSEQNIAVFATLSLSTQRQLVISQNGGRELIFHYEMHLL